MLTASTPLGSVPGLDAPVSDVFIEAARRAPQAPFIDSRSHPAESVTFGAFLEQALRAGTALARAGVTPGRPVALLAENRPRWCAAHAGILFAGGVVVAIDAQVSHETLVLILRDSGAEHAFVSSASAPKLREAARELGRTLHVLSLDDDTGPDTEPWSRVQSELRELPRPSGGEQPYAIVYTSGTTGLPKGCVLTHANMRHELHGMPIAGRLVPSDVILQFLPLHHVLAQVGTYIGPAAIGMRIVHATIHRAEDLTSALKEGGVTVLLAVPQVFHLLHARIRQRLTGLRWPFGMLLDWMLGAFAALRESTGWNAGALVFAPVRRALGPKLRLFVSGGAALDLRAQKDFLALGWAMIQAYGLTETSGGAFADDPLKPRAGTVGFPMPGVEAKLHEPGADGVGEICMRARLVTPGYHQRPEATAEILRDGWLHTGDLGRFDDSGRLVIAGRRKEVIVLGSGKNVNPEELESAYARSPWIQELCVMAVPRDDGAGEKLHAVVVPQWDRFREKGVGNVREAIRFELQETALRLPPYQRVTSFELRRDPLPRTTTRKLQRYLIQPGQDASGPREPGPPDPRLASGDGARFAEILRRRAGEKADLRTDAHLELDLGLDSLERMEVALAVQSELGLRLTDEEIAQAATVGAVLDLIESGAGKTGPAPASWQETLAEASDADLPPLLRKGRGPVVSAVVVAGLWVMRQACRVAFRLRAEGLENLPKNGPLMVCPNHVSYLDGFVVGVLFPARLVRIGFVLGEAGYVTQPLARPLAALAGVVPVDPARHLRQALRAGAAGLKRGLALLIFPEGERSADGRLGTIKLGAPILAAELKVPVVPAVVDGAYEAWPRGEDWPRPRRIVVRFGPPLDPRRIIPEGTPPAEAHALMAREIRAAWLRLGAKEPE